MGYCKNCGVEFQNGNKFCGNCGSSLDDDTQAIINKQSAKIFKSKRHLSIIGLLFLGILAAVLILNLRGNNMPQNKNTNLASTVTPKASNAVSNNNSNKNTESTITNNDKTSKPNNASTGTPTDTNVNQTQNNNASNTNISSIFTDDKWANLYQGGVIESVDGGTYEVKKMIAINKSLMVAVNSFRTAIDESSFSNGKYYLVVDFLITDVSTKDYYSSMYNFTLSDSAGYSYNPNIAYNTTGSLDGLIKTKGIIRGEVAFQVLGNQSQFVLHFRTKAGLNSTSNFEIINFKIDTNTLKQKQ